MKDNIVVCVAVGIGLMAAVGAALWGIFFGLELLNAMFSNKQVALGFLAVFPMSIFAYLLGSGFLAAKRK